MGLKKRFFGCGGRSEERADRVVRPYGCGGRFEMYPKTNLQPSGAVADWKGSRKERICRFRRQPETEWSELLLTPWP